LISDGDDFDGILHHCSIKEANDPALVLTYVDHDTCILISNGVGYSSKLIDKQDRRDLQISEEYLFERGLKSRRVVEG
jgi:hypothetical protein